MTVRTECAINRLVDGVVEKLETIAKRKDPRFLSNPKTVGRAFLLGDVVQRQKPFLGVQVLGWTASPQTAQRFDGTLRVGVHCVSESTKEAEATLARLVSDVVLALSEDVTLDGEAISCFPVEFEPNVDLAFRTGLAITTVVFEVFYRWEFDAP